MEGLRLQTILGVLDNPNHPLYKYWNISLDRWPDLVGCKCPHLSSTDECPEINKTWLFYHVIGAGSHGVVYLARHRENPNLHVAVKRIADEYDEQEILKTQVHENHPRILDEAYVLAVLAGSSRINSIIAQYVHGNDRYIVMELFGVPITDAMRNAQEIHCKSEECRPFTGETFIVDEEGKKEARLVENDVCKIVSHLLGGMLYAKDRGVIHTDINQRNFLVDSQLNAQLIDFGISPLCPDDDFIRYYSFIPRVENQVLPEVIDPQDFSVRRAAFDLRKNDVWLLGILAFELLHGCPPWQDRSYEGWEQNVIGSYADGQESREQRRERILRLPVPINENLSEDCKDALRAMLQTNPEDRATLEDLITLPWFSGWYVDSDHVFRRPVPEQKKMQKRFFSLWD
ncbi:hypothetical protein FGG08_001313 [Glutinoglossum americanum]|uniref:non-specific serine/threonine protein kinase n=1 Tax=Glutinoglossum americanum TaxID=1670608 RepID=A0A9P8L2V9_9PEZI|nr:hypothetical protein FGG08_001313 [Glutinoglossum americanum]